MMLRAFRGWGALVIGLVAALQVTGAIPAQDAAEDEVGNPRVVSPAECQVEPRAVTEIAQILHLDADGVPAPLYRTITAPLGEFADPATKLSINETTRELLACFNAGDIPRATALMTEQGITRAYWGLTIDQTAREATKARLSGPPQPRPVAGQLRLITVTDTSFLPDGRVAAFVVLNDPLLPPPGPETLLVYFAHRDGLWLLDDWVDFTIIPASSEATPAP